MMDKMMYKSTNKGNATTQILVNTHPNIMHRQSNRKTHRMPFPFQPKVLNFRANIGIGLTNNTLNITMTGGQIIMDTGSIPISVMTTGIEMKNNAFAGVGKPIKSSA